MHREHNASLNPTCALRAPFVFHTFHSSINLRRTKEEESQTPTRHNENNSIEHNAHRYNDENTP